MRLEPLIQHVAKAFLAAGYGGALPAAIEGYPKTSLVFFIVGVVAHIIAYKPQKSKQI